MQIFGVTANNMSMFGFIIVLGIVVDDAIVTGENIYSRLKDGKLSSFEAAVVGTQEVATPVTFGIITTIVAFVPLMFIEGYIGEMAKQVPLVVIPVLIFSLIESKLILPAHLKHLKRDREKATIIIRIQRTIANSMEHLVENVYQPILRFTVNYRYVTVAAFFSILLVVIGYQTTQEFNPTPSTDRYIIRASLEMMNGTTFEQTDAKSREIVAAAESLKSKPEFQNPETGESYIQNIVDITGGRKWSPTADPTNADIMVEITPPSQRPGNHGPNNSEIATAWREAVGEIQRARSFHIRAQTNSSKISGNSERIEVLLSGNNEENKVKFAEELKTWLRAHENLESAYISKRSDQREFLIQLTPEGLEAGLSQEDLARQVRNAFFGTQVQQIQKGEDEVRVMVKLPKDMRSSIHTLETLRIGLPGNKTASINQFAKVVESSSPSSIERRDGSRIVTIIGNPESEFKVPSIEAELTAKLNELSSSYSGVSWQYLGTLAEYKETNQRLYTLAGLLTFTLFALLAIPFKSFLQPFYVIIAVPFGVIGAFIGHYILDLQISYLSYFGILALAGIVVNDSLVMVDFINSKRLQILTSITTFAGLLPIIFETSIEAQFLIPMAVSLGFGILFATVITLFLIPCAYSVGEDIKELLGIKGIPGADEA